MEVRWMVRDSSDDEGYLTVQGVQLFYRLDGPVSAPVVALVNSLGMDLHMWEPQLPRLSERFRVLRFDARGHGHSQVPTGPYTMDQLGGDLVALFNELGIPRAHICGLSLGGMVALWLAVYRPECVGRVVLANTAARIGTEVSWNERIRAIENGGMAAIRDMVVGRFLSLPFRRQHPETAEWVASILEATPSDGYIGSCRALAEADLSEVARHVETPCLVIGSLLDEATPPAQAEELAALLRTSQLTLLADAAHLSNIEQADAFTDLVISFFEADR
jgi:3-oxoadipate enol-lactonase